MLYVFNRSIPYGSLMMLPPDFPENQSNLDLRKVVKTLKMYGAYVVDRNVGTPFVIYVENYTSATIPPFNLHKNGTGTTEWNKWDNVVANWLVQIQHALRVVKSADDWIDGNGDSISVVVSAPITAVAKPASAPLSAGHILVR